MFVLNLSFLQKFQRPIQFPPQRLFFRAGFPAFRVRITRIECIIIRLLLFSLLLKITRRLNTWFLLPLTSFLSGRIRRIRPFMLMLRNVHLALLQRLIVNVDVHHQRVGGRMVLGALICTLIVGSSEITEIIHRRRRRRVTRVKRRKRTALVRVTHRLYIVARLVLLLYYFRLRTLKRIVRSEVWFLSTWFIRHFRRLLW